MFISCRCQKVAIVQYQLILLPLHMTTGYSVWLESTEPPSIDPFRPLIYIWFTYDLHLIYIWFTSVQNWKFKCKQVHLCCGCWIQKQIRSKTRHYLIVEWGFIQSFTIDSKGFTNHLRLVQNIQRPEIEKWDIRAPLQWLVTLFAFKARQQEDYILEKRCKYDQFSGDMPQII